MNGSISFSGDLTGSIDQGGGTGSVPVVTATATVDANTGTPSVNVTRSGTDANPNFNFSFKNLRGETGQTGAAGQNGQNGTDGFSPAVTLSSITGGTRVSITDATHPSGQIFDVMNGQNGQNGTDGTNGTNGVSPAVTISTITGGHRVNITDATHPSGQNFDVMDGQRGETGSQGPQGEQGPAGVGIAVGGTAGQILKKAGSSDYVTGWYDNDAAGVSFDNTDLEIISHDTVQLALEDLDAAVDTINASLTQKQDAITLTPLSNGNYGSFENGGYFTIGNLVIFDVTFTVGSGGATTGQNLITGFPSISQNDKPFFCMMMGNVNNDLKAVRIYQSGLYPNSNFGAGRYHAYGMYIKS